MDGKLTTMPAAAERYVQQLTAAGQEVKVTEFQKWDEVYGKYFTMCLIEWKRTSIVTADAVPHDAGQRYVVVEEEAVLPSNLYGWGHYVWGVGHVALDALGAYNAKRYGEKFSPEIGEVFWVVTPPGVGFMPTIAAYAAAEVASWPSQKWQRKE